MERAAFQVTYQEVIPMAEKANPGPISASSCGDAREAVCIHTKKIYDSCREEDTAPLRPFAGVRRREYAELALSMHEC